MRSVDQRQVGSGPGGRVDRTLTFDAVALRDASQRPENSHQIRPGSSEAAQRRYTPLASVRGIARVIKEFRIRWSGVVEVSAVAPLFRKPAPAKFARTRGEAASNRTRKRLVDSVSAMVNSPSIGISL